MIISQGCYTDATCSPKGLILRQTVPRLASGGSEVAPSEAPASLRGDVCAPVPVGERGGGGVESSGLECSCSRESPDIEVYLIRPPSQGSLGPLFPPILRLACDHGGSGKKEKSINMLKIYIYF